MMDASALPSMTVVMTTAALPPAPSTLTVIYGTVHSRPTLSARPASRPNYMTISRRLSQVKD